MSSNYIIYTFPYSENNGGAIFMHQLAHELNRIGETAYLWRARPVYPLGLKGRFRHWRKRGPMLTNPELDTPVAKRSHLTRDSIVVYPEIVRGNPLKARNVVRWLLYKPGIRHPYDFGTQEMFFRAGEMSDLKELTGGAPDLFLWKVNRTYQNENRSDRKGVCYIVRKGDGKQRIPETEAPGAIQIDGMSHSEINDVFNRCSVFYSYDEATMYSQYAAVTGCTSIVIPGFYSSRKEWVKNHQLARFGVAYGLDDIAHAEATKDMVLPLLEAEEAKGRATVERFVELTRKRFGADNLSR